MTDYIIFFQIKKYVGVQSWKAMHLPTLDIRVKQMGNRTIKWEIQFGSQLQLCRKRRGRNGRAVGALLHPVLPLLSYIAAIETQIEFSIFWCDSPSVSLEYPKLANAQPSNFGPLRIY